MIFWLISFELRIEEKEGKKKNNKLFKGTSLLQTINTLLIVRINLPPQAITPLCDLQVVVPGSCLCSRKVKKKKIGPGRRFSTKIKLFARSTKERHPHKC